MRITLTFLAVTVALFGSYAESKPLRQDIGTAAPQTFTLYPPHDKTTGRYDESKACFSFKLGVNKPPETLEWDLGYGFAQINYEDWLIVGLPGTRKRTVMKELGIYDWSDSFKVRMLEPLPELKQGEQRHIVVDSGGDTHKEWAKATTFTAKAEAGHMYLMRVKDHEVDFYVLFRVEEIVQGDHCTISWKQIPAPKK